MRRVLATLFLATSIGLFALPAFANPIQRDGSQSTLALSYDYSDNDAAPAVSNGPFNVIVDVLPEPQSGLVRMIAIAPDNSTSPNIVCPLQSLQQSQVECSFRFTDSGIWKIRAQYLTDPKGDVVLGSITKLRVFN